MLEPICAGMHADLNETFCVGSKTSDIAKRLVKSSYDSLMLAIAAGIIFLWFSELISLYLDMEELYVL